MWSAVKKNNKIIIIIKLQVREKNQQIKNVVVSVLIIELKYLI